MVVGWASEAGEGFFEQTARTGNGQQQEQRQERQRCRLKMCDRFWWVKARRGPSTAQLAKGASCFAQDDGFSGGVGKNRQRQEQVVLAVYIPTHRDVAAMDGAPERLW